MLLNEFYQPLLEKGEIVPVIDAKKLAAASSAGFDTSTIWYHGTRRNFSKFRLPKRGGIDELGKGVYVTSFIGTANVWAQGDGFVLACVLRRGKLMELSDMPRSSLWHEGDPGNALWQEVYKGYQIDLNHRRVEYEADTEYHEFIKKHGMRPLSFEDGGFRAFADKYDKGQISLATCLSNVGYIGATSRYSQIRGQAVIWSPDDVRVVGKAAGYDGFVSDD